MRLITALLIYVFLAPGGLSAFENVTELKAYTRLDSKLVRESSAFLKSPSLKNIYWTINDSGNTPALFAFTRDGSPVKPGSVPDADYKGIVISSAANVDWEAMAADDRGNIIIADAGNNRNRRKNLAVYFLPEPDPSQVVAVMGAKKIMFRYPDQKKFPPKQMNFDAESLFWANGRLYLITKHRFDTRAKLYRFNSVEPGVVDTLKLISSFDIQAMATDAAVTSDGRKLALLTYAGVWLFEKPEGSDDYFSGPHSRLSFGAGQCEGITFDGPDTLLISNENNELFEIKTADLK